VVSPAITPVINPVATVSLDETGVTPEGINATAEANNQFAFDFYTKHKSDSNFFFSPYSVSSAMSMVYEGAKGDTATQISDVFHLPDIKVLESSSARLYNEINKANKSYSLNTANALWAQKDYAFLPDYLNTVGEYYGGKLTNLDFKINTENSRITINNWVADQTNQKIKDLIPQGTIDSFTRLVLTNAIYFKGKWDKQFVKINTKPEDFDVALGNTIKTDTMQLTGEDANFKYAEDNNVQILNLPYQGNDLSMILILPKTGKSIQDAEKYLSVKELSGLKSEMQNIRVNVYIPKFKLETKYFMKEDLSNMGMPAAFSGFADFSGMTGNKDLTIGQVIHQAFVEVNEEGTEAAAATAITMQATAMQSPVSIKTFRADHPFLFLIQQNSTGNILFLGRLNNPAQ
jgi:serpin B